ncbi:MAG: response regulator, partial [Bacteroidales bacterium]|nr:response regulator [Bacteroidales bacterium]
LIGTEPKLINNKYYHANYQEDIKAILMSGKPWHGDLQNETSEGETYWEQSSITPIFNDKGVIVNFAGIHTDITELKQTQAELVIAKELADAAAKAKSTFLANMSHEIRTPMNAVLGYSELLGRILKDPTQKNYLESILLSGKNLLSLINDILDLSKIEAGKIELHYSNVDARAFFDEFKKLFALTVANKKLDFSIDLPTDFPNTIKIDDVRLRQVLLNIIGNAVKFTHKGYVKLSIYGSNARINEDTGSENLDLNIIVEDSGIGMTKNFVTNIFQPFSQASRSYGGTGLGLSITSKLIQTMGGTITVKSEPDMGSIFHLAIPNVRFQQEIVETVSYETADSESAMFNNLKLVVVDDVQHNRALVTDTLSDRGIELFEAENGALGLEVIRKVRPDIEISDLRMPVMNGFKLLEAIRKDPELAKTTVIVYSASVTERERERIERHSFDGSLMKPLIIKDLFNMLAQKFPDRILKAESTEDKSGIEPITENITDIDGLLNILNNELTATWSTFREKQPLKEIKIFAEQLIQTGEKHNSNTLKEYGETLKMAAMNFNVKGIIKEINNFPNLIEQHKKLKK